ncbi:MAG: hypothetical protein WCL06_03560 [Bacteroidota bacterium]
MSDTVKSTKKVSETGHVPNLENFGKEIIAVTEYADLYNPSNDLLKILHLQTVQTNAANALQQIIQLETPRSNVLKARMLLFHEMMLYTTRIFCALQASKDVNKVIIQGAQYFVRKIRGERKSAKILNPSPEDAKQISASQHCYFNQAQFFSRFINFVLSQPGYTPNETELLAPAMHDFEASLNQINVDAAEANAPWLLALSDRNEIFYAPTTGLVDIAYAVKKYVRSVKAITPVQYSLISGLRYRRPKKSKKKQLH